MSDTEVAAEQQYFDQALECREANRARVARQWESGIHKGAVEGLKKQAEAELRKYPEPDADVAFARFDMEDGTVWYVGRQTIHDRAQDLVVVDWRAEPVADPQRATADDPCGVTRRRNFTCDRNQIQSFDDIVWADLLADVTRLEEPHVDDALLKDLQKHRSGEMEDIVRTIQAAQHDILRSDLDQLLIIEGGPGTGKTAVALHRVSWLLFNHVDTLAPSAVLVVGPSKTFVRYIKQVLPALGDHDVVQRDIQALAPQVRSGGMDPPETERLKGEARMSGLITRAIQDRIRPPEEDLQMRAAGLTVRIDARQLREQIDRLRSRPYMEGRDEVRQWLRTKVTEARNDVSTFEPEIARLVDRVWLGFTPPAFLRELLGSRERLVSAAGDDFTAADINRLYRQSADRVSEERWSPADGPLLDLVAHLLDGPKETFAHIVVDEAQDLSPMQLSMLHRRSEAGSYTILGDIAQSSGPWARDDWEDVVAMLQKELPVHFETLRFGYRVPRQIYELAEQLLPSIAPNVSAPRVVRPGPVDPTLLERALEDLAGAAVAEAQRYAGMGRSVGVICPDSLRSELISALDQSNVLWVDAREEGITGGISLISASDAKGLEFDAVVVVEPAKIADGTREGLRLLYVALTRSTNFLSVVHSGIVLPKLDDPEAVPSQPPLDLPGTERPTVQERLPLETGGTATTRREDSRRVPRAIDALAGSLAEDIRDLPEESWDLVIERIRHHLNAPPGSAT